MLKVALRKYISQHHPGLLAAFRAARRSWNLGRQKSRLTSYGFKFAAVVDSFDFEAYEADERAFVRQHLMEGEVLVDVGANVGMYTCMALALGKHVVAIEPLAWNLSYLFFNLKENDWSNVEVFPVGVSQQPGIAEFHGSSMSASLVKGWAARFNAVEGSQPEKQITPVSTLDILVGNRFAGRRVVVKIDVEGAEYYVLCGAQALLTSTPRPVWLVEVFSGQHHPSGYNPYFAQVFELFWRYGYTARDMSGKVLQPEEVRAWAAQRVTIPTTNFVFRCE